LEKGNSDPMAKSLIMGHNFGFKDKKKRKRICGNIILG